MNDAASSPSPATHKPVDVGGDLLARRDQLKMRSEYLRQQLSLKSSRAQPALRAADRVGDGLGWVKAHPAAMVVASAALLGAIAARPRTFVRLGARALSVWQVAQRVQPLVRAFMRQG